MEYLLEQGTLADMLRAKEITSEILKFQWAFYYELAQQRAQIHEELLSALVGRSCSFNFREWQRLVKHQYSVHPLCTNGSLRFDGQRFNTGAELNPDVPSFPALYIASDKETALMETLGQPKPEKPGLTAMELALTNTDSVTIFSVSGDLDRVFDLRTPESLEPFVKLIEDFKFSDGLLREARRYGIDVPRLATTASELHDTLLRDDWRKMPGQFDLPANSQIFGHLVFLAGLEGIVYPSKMSRRDCLAVFPRNFAFTSSWLALDGELPVGGTPRRIDGTNCRLCDIQFDDLPR